MSFKIALVELAKGRQMLAGATLGEELYRELLAPAVARSEESTILLLSLRGAQFVTSSFLKATWLKLHPEDGSAVPSMVSHLSEDVRIEFTTFLRGHRLPGLEASDWSSTGVSKARLHGHYEDAAASALLALARKPGATAPELHLASKDQVTATAWTNRLNELHRLGLVARKKAGRAWRFFPLAKEFEHG